MLLDKRALNFVVIAILTLLSVWWTSFIFHQPINYIFIMTVIATRSISSYFVYQDYSLSWSKATQISFLIKAIVNILAFLVYAPIYYGDIRISFMASELFFYMFTTSFLMYGYYYIINKNKKGKNKTVVIYGAGSAGTKLQKEFYHSDYEVICFIDDDLKLQNRSVDNISILSSTKFHTKYKDIKVDLLVIAIPSASKNNIKAIYEKQKPHFHAIKILPSLDDMLRSELYSSQLKEISVEDLLARHPKDLDKTAIKNFIEDKIILITGAGGSIGSEISRQCIKFGAQKLILVDHSEYNLYTIEQELVDDRVVPVMQSVVNISDLDKTFERYRPDIVIHAAAYKHVPLCEENISEAIKNNVLGTKNTIDCAVKYNVEKFVLISTDKAVRPTNVMGATKRICELYAQNKPCEVSLENKTEIVAVRFGNVLGSSGSVIPKFKSQIQAGKNITVTHPEITRYFMLIPEACELVLQAGSIGKGGEIFILDMGEPIKIANLAAKMIELSGREDISIEYTGLRPGEKLYEELLIDDSDAHTNYDSITVAVPTYYDIDKLSKDIDDLVYNDSSNQLKQLKYIVPEFDHKP